MPAPAVQRACSGCAAGGATCSKCETEKRGRLQRKTEGISESSDSVPDGFVPSLGAGRPLDAHSRAFFEPRFGQDFSRVRVHADEQAHRAASQIQARAFTYGRNIYLGSGESERNRALMAHELTHVIQQGAAGRESSDTRSGVDDGAGIQRTPKAQCPDGVKTVTVDLVSLRGSTRDAPDDLDFANSIYRPCCVQFALGSGVSVVPSLSDTWLGGDTAMSRGTTRGAIHAEQTASYDGATAAFGLSGRIRAFYVDSLVGGSRATSFPRNWATGTAAPYEGMVIVTNGGARRSLAHEFGHILLDADGGVHTTHPGGADNIMEPTDSATGETLEPAQCATIFTNS